MRFNVCSMAVPFFALLLVGNGLAVAGSDPQRDAEIAMFYKAGLPNNLLQELDSIQAIRNQHNAMAASYTQQVQSFRGKIQHYKSTCVRRRLSPSHASSCRSLRSSLDSENAQLSHQGRRLLENRDDVIRRYENFKVRANIWLNENAAAASGSSKQQASGASFPLAYQRGLSDAKQCYPSNSAGFCHAFSDHEFQICDDGYREGFAAGDQIRTQTMERAWQIGFDSAKGGKENSNFNHPDAQGPCRIQWIEQYNRGHFQGRMP